MQVLPKRAAKRACSSARSTIQGALVRKRRVGKASDQFVAPALHSAEWVMIRGSITTRDVLLNASMIVRGFGLGTFVRCLRALLTGRCTTFLELAWPR